LTYTHLWLESLFPIGKRGTRDYAPSDSIQSEIALVDIRRAIDGVLRLFQPDRDPGEIKPKRTYARRTRYFARNELSRLCMDALRVANGALLTTDRHRGADHRSKGLRHG
jgi:hypothetical protein